MLLLALLCGACSPNVATAMRGSVETFQDGRMISSRRMVEKEARAVTAWFKTNGSGWSRNMGASPPTLMIRVKHSNFETTVINVSGTTVVVTNSSGQFKKKPLARRGRPPARARRRATRGGRPISRPLAAAGKIQLCPRLPGP